MLDISGIPDRINGRRRDMRNQKASYRVTGASQSPPVSSPPVAGFSAKRRTDQ